MRRAAFVCFERIRRRRPFVYFERMRRAAFVYFERMRRRRVRLLREDTPRRVRLFREDTPPPSVRLFREDAPPPRLFTSRGCAAAAVCLLREDAPPPSVCPLLRYGYVRYCGECPLLRFVCPLLRRMQAANAGRTVRRSPPYRNAPPVRTCTPPYAVRRRRPYVCAGYGSARLYAIAGTPFAAVRFAAPSVRRTRRLYVPVRRRMPRRIPFAPDMTADGSARLYAACTPLQARRRVWRRGVWRRIWRRTGGA